MNQATLFNNGATFEQIEKVKEWEFAGFNFDDCQTFDECVDKFLQWFDDM